MNRSEWSARPRVLIVGAGALGITCAWHLQRAGADITFLVRLHRIAALEHEQTLYCYNDQTVKALEPYSVLSDVAELPGQSYDFILLTLDGASCRTEQGMATIAALGQAFAPQSTKMIICGVGIGLYEHVRSTSGFSAENLCEGSMRMFAYQVAMDNTPLPAAEYKAQHDSATIAYQYFSDRVGFFLSSRPKIAAKKFAALWNQCEEVSCRLMPPVVYAPFSNIFFAFTVASELGDWQGIEALLADRALWHMCCEAQREIMRLKEHGLMGLVMSLFMSDKRLEKMMRQMEQDAEPMGFTAFNRLHHGGKVLAQDIQILERCVALGEGQGKSMNALKDLLSQWRNAGQRNLSNSMDSPNNVG